MTKVGRNDPCPCGSGKKYKKCHPNEYDPSVILFSELASWELTACVINDDYREIGLATVIIIRENQAGDRFSFAAYLCDIFCLGLKDVHFEMNVDENRLQLFIVSKVEQQSFEPMSYIDAKNLIMGSIDYAESLGFDPHPDFSRSKVLIEDGDTRGAKKFTYGKHGKPFYITGPNDNYRQVIQTLEDHCGKGNFDYEIDERSGFSYDR